jgi:transcription elongation factor GreA
MQDKAVYLTAEGKERFTAELRELTTVRRQEVAERIRRAKEYGDTSDNAEYDLAKSEQAFVEGRIQELERMLSGARVIEEPTTVDYVRLGSRVTVLASDGEEDTYQLVGKQEADPRRGFVSNESPIGRALLGKRVGDETVVVAPGGSFTVRVLRIASH